MCVKKSSSLGRNSGFSIPSKCMEKETVLLGFLSGEKRTSVWVIAFDKVKLNDALSGICVALFPQYLISAILLGACQRV